MNREIIETAAKAMKVSYEEAEKHCKPVPEINGWCFWNPVRGGIRVLINGDGEKLAATSGLNFKKQLEDFLAGRRN